MGACASRPQKQQREWTAATNKPRKHGIGALWKNKGIQQQQIGGGGGGTSTTPIFRCTDEASSTTATTSSSANPKTFNAPQAAARSPEENVPFEILRGSIFPFLSGVCLARAGSTCRSWGEASVDEHLWKALCLKRWAGKHVGKCGCETVSTPGCAMVELIDGSTTGIPFSEPFFCCARLQHVHTCGTPAGVGKPVLRRQPLNW